MNRIRLCSFSKLLVKPPLHDLKALDQERLRMWRREVGESLFSALAEVGKMCRLECKLQGAGEFKQKHMDVQGNARCDEVESSASAGGFILMISYSV